MERSLIAGDERGHSSAMTRGFRLTREAVLLHTCAHQRRVRGDAAIDDADANAACACGRRQTTSDRDKGSTGGLENLIIVRLNVGRDLTQTLQPVTGNQAIWNTKMYGEAELRIGFAADRRKAGWGGGRQRFGEEGISANEAGSGLKLMKSEQAHPRHSDS
jgi:hypothetical protein